MKDIKELKKDRRKYQEEVKVIKRKKSRIGSLENAMETMDKEQRNLI